MKKFFAALAAALLITTAASALTVKEAAEKLGNASAAVIQSSGGQAVCSAAKIGERQFLTARHCVDMNIKLRTKSGQILEVDSALVTLQNKSQGRKEDWAILNTHQDDVSATALTLGCKTSIELGMDVAYAGYPDPTKYALGLGRITTQGPIWDKRNSLDWGMDVHAAPGASGSPVIDVATGTVIGVLVEAIFADRAGVYMIGFEDIKNTDMCAEPVNSNPTPMNSPDAGQK